MESIFKTLSDGRFEGDRLDEPLPALSPVERVKRIFMTPEERRRKDREHKKRYNERHPEQRIADSHNRRARIRKAGGKLTAKECREILDKYGNKCLKCGSTENITLDHVIPIALGGMNTADNIQTLCMMCNSFKGTSVVDYR